MYLKCLKRNIFRHPPDKRPNFIKLGVVSPFSAPWSRLVQDYLKDDLGFKSKGAKSKEQEDPKNYFVQRDKAKLNEIRSALNGNKKVK